MKDFHQDQSAMTKKQEKEFVMPMEVKTTVPKMHCESIPKFNTQTDTHTMSLKRVMMSPQFENMKTYMFCHLDVS